MKKVIEYILKFAVLAILFFILFWKVGFTEIWSLFKDINLGWIFAFFVIYGSTKLLTTFNISILLKAIKKQVNFRTLFSYQLLTGAVALYLPGGTGEVSLTMLLHKRQGLDYGEGLAIQLVDKIITSIFFAFFSLLGLLFYLDLSSTYIYVILGTLILGTTFVVSLWSINVRKIIKKFILRKYSKYFRNFSKSFKFIIQNRKKYLILNFINTGVLIAFIFLGGFLVFKSFNYTVPLLAIAYIHSLITILGYLPLPLSGLGVKELSTIFLFTLVSVPLSVITAYMLFNLLFKYIFFSGIYWHYGRLLWK